MSFVRGWQSLELANDPSKAAEGTTVAVGAGSSATVAPIEPPPWVQDLVSGNSYALRDAYAENHVSVRAFARRLLGDAQAAEDLVQEVFLALPRAISGYRGDSPVASFLIGIAANKARKLWRGAARRRAAYAQLSEHLDPSATPVEERLGRRQLAAKLLDGLEQLSLEQRVCFVLRVVEERSAADVARILGVPATTVRDRAQAARRRLQRWGEEEGLA